MPSLGNLLVTLHVEEKRLIRKIEKLCYKKNACRAAILFNEIIIIIIIIIIRRRRRKKRILCLL